MRNTLSAVIFGVTLTAATLASSAGFAHPAYAPGAEPKVQTPHQNAGNMHKLAGSVIDYGDLATQIGQGYTLVDSNTVVCSKASCTIAVDMQEQIAGNGQAGNWFAVCAEVDGAFATYGCPYAGEAPTDGSYIDSRQRQTFSSVARGTHTVAVYVYVNGTSAYSENFDVAYNVLTP